MNQTYQDPDLYFLRDKPFLGFEPPAWIRVTDGRYKETAPNTGGRPVDAAWEAQRDEAKRLKAAERAAAREEKRLAAWAARSAERKAKAAHLAKLREEASQKFQAQRAEFQARKESKRVAQAQQKARAELVAELVAFEPVVVATKRQTRTKYDREYSRAHRQKGTGRLGQSMAQAVVYMWPDGRLEHFASKLALAKALGKSPSVVRLALEKNCGMMADGGMVRVRG